MSSFYLSQPFHLLFFSSLLLPLVFHDVPTANAQNNLKPLDIYCDPAANYTNTSTFATNLQLVLSYLSSESSLSQNRGFVNGKIELHSNATYGQSLCRGDSSSTECYDCINKASESILSNCNYSKSAAIWYDTCQLRYSDTNFFGNSTSLMWFYVRNITNVRDPYPFKTSLGKLMNGLAKRVESEPRLRNFATGEANYTSAKSVYGLVQCVPDISGAECQKCLQEAINQLPNCCDRRIGGRVIGHVCGLRFEISKFYQESNIVEGPLPSPAPSTAPADDDSPPAATGSENNSSRTIVFLIWKIVGAIILSIIVTLI